MLDRGKGQHRQRRRVPSRPPCRRRDPITRAIEPLESRHLLAIVAVLGDIQGGTNANSVANVVKGWNPGYIVSVGDNYYAADGVIDNTIGQYYHDYVSPYTGAWGAGSPSGNRFWSAIGNHEYEHSPGAANYFGFFQFPGNERYYKLTQENVDWFFVNSNPEELDGNTVGSAQYNWLQGEMAASSATWKFVVFHHPPYSSADSADNTNMRWPFREWGASAVFSGHHHVYERLNVDGLPYFISGLGGASIQSFGEVDPNSQFRYDIRHGALRLDIGASSVKFEFFNRDGTLIDMSTITAPVGPGTPTNLTAAPYSAGRIDLSWTDNATDETNFIVERSPDGLSNWTLAGTPAADAATFSDNSPGLLPGVTYHYRVRAALPGGAQTTNSHVASATTLQPGYFNWIPRGATWKYLDTGVNQGTAWRNIAFDDTTWSIGRGQLGFGDGDEATVVSYGPDPAAKFPTTYFRKAFTVDDPARVIQLDLSLLRDDGAVVYLNGTEVWRSNMPAGNINYGTWASTPQGDLEEAVWHGLTISPALLVAGDNVLAVEVHQDNGLSTDLSFDFALAARLAAGLAPPSAFRATTVAHDQVTLRWVDTAVGEAGFKIERSTDGVTFVQIGTAAAGATTFTDNTVTGDKQYWYRARSYNGSGDSHASSVAAVATPLAPDQIPAPWSNGDIGAVAAAGSATHNGGVFVLNGSGAGIAGTADEFHYLSQPWTGNGTIIARVSGLSGTTSKAGVMFREAMTTGSRHVTMSITPTSGIVIQGRGSTNGNTSGPPNTAAAAPVWLKLVRNGNTFTAQHSSDGQAWATISSATIAMNAAVFVGVCVTSGSDGALASGTFDNVSVSSATALSDGSPSSSPPRPGHSKPDRPPKDKVKDRVALTDQVGLRKDALGALT